MTLTRLSHVALGTDDPDAMIDYYRGLFGLREVARRGDVVFLASGTSAGCDLVLGPWERGVDHFAFAVAERESIAEARARLEAGGVEVTEVDLSIEHGVEDGIRFVAPSGHVVELVYVPASVYTPRPMVDPVFFTGAGPVLLEHITLGCGDVEGLADFLGQYLGMRLTESVRHADGSWFNAFMRVRDRHHDIAFFANDDGDRPGLNHFCFAVPSVDALITVADLAAERGVFLDASVGRHISGNNVFIYLKDPDGNRVEVNTDMAWIDPAAPPRVISQMRFDAWRESIPPTMLAHSRCRDGRAGATAGASATEGQHGGV